MLGTVNLDRRIAIGQLLRAVGQQRDIARDPASDDARQRHGEDSGDQADQGHQPHHAVDNGLTLRAQHVLAVDRGFNHCVKAFLHLGPDCIQLVSANRVSLHDHVADLSAGL